MRANSRGRGWIAVLAAALTCRTPHSQPAVSRAGPALGAMFSVAAWGGGPDSARLAAAVQAAFDSVALVDSLSTTPDSLPALLATAAAVARSSHGAYGRRDAAPIARGYALDRAALALSGVVDSAVLDLGGQYLLLGGPRGGNRGVGVPDPDDELTLLALVGVAPGHSLATTARPANPGDVRDPRTGRPATRARSVTVVAGSGAIAAAWSRAFFVLGCDTALAQARGAGVAVVCADAGGVRWTDDLTGQVKQSSGSAADSGRTGTGKSPAAPPGPASGRRSPSSRSGSSRTARRAARPAS